LSVFQAAAPLQSTGFRLQNIMIYLYNQLGILQLKKARDLVDTKPLPGGAAWVSPHRHHRDSRYAEGQCAHDGIDLCWASVEQWQCTKPKASVSPVQYGGPGLIEGGTRI
jgi:hypothetical protein